MYLYLGWFLVGRREGWWHREELEVVSGVMENGEGGVNILRPVLTASRPSQTMAAIGPLPISIIC
jgi:hypothetical protein